MHYSAGWRTRLDEEPEPLTQRALLREQKNAWQDSAELEDRSSSLAKIKPPQLSPLGCAAKISTNVLLFNDLLDYDRDEVKVPDTPEQPK